MTLQEREEINQGTSKPNENKAIVAHVFYWELEWDMKAYRYSL